MYLSSLRDMWAGMIPHQCSSFFSRNRFGQRWWRPAVSHAPTPSQRTRSDTEGVDAPFQGTRPVQRPVPAAAHAKRPDEAGARDILIGRRRHCSVVFRLGKNFFSGKDQKTYTPPADMGLPRRMLFLRAASPSLRPFAIKKATGLPPQLRWDLVKSMQFKFSKQVAEAKREEGEVVHLAETARSLLRCAGLPSSGPALTDSTHLNGAFLIFCGKQSYHCMPWRARVGKGGSLFCNQESLRSIIIHCYWTWDIPIKVYAMTSKSR